MKSYDYTQHEDIETPEDVQAFFEEIDKVCKKYNLSISHEAEQGSFIINTYAEENISWLRNAILLIIG